MKSAALIYENILNKKSMLCVGLDPDFSKIPKAYHHFEFPVLEMCKDIVDVTNSLAIAYKINIAFFESMGVAGWQQLEQLIKYLPAEALIIADAKRADIGNTSQQYADYYFKTLNVDALTLHPYMGIDSLEPFLKYTSKWSVILALTSNKGSHDLELEKMANGEFLYERVLKLFMNSGYSDNIMFVCGATHPDTFINIRKHCPEQFILVPGIGTQGGDLQQILKTGMISQGGLIINVSRKICYPELSNDYKKAVWDAAKSYQEIMATYL